MAEANTSIDVNRLVKHELELQRAKDEREGTPGPKLFDCFVQQIELMMSDG